MYALCHTLCILRPSWELDQHHQFFDSCVISVNCIYPGEQEWGAFATVVLSPHYTNCQGQWWCKYSFLASTTFQQPGNSQIKWTRKEWTQPTPQTTVETREPCLVAERPRVHAEVSFEAVNVWPCTEPGNSALLISKKDLNKPNDGYPIIHNERCNYLFSFSFVGIYSWWLTQACHSYYS